MLKHLFSFAETLLFPALAVILTSKLKTDDYKGWELSRK